MSMDLCGTKTDKEQPAVYDSIKDQLLNMWGIL